MYAVGMYVFLRGLSVIFTKHVEQLVLQMFASEASGDAGFITRR